MQIGWRNVMRRPGRLLTTVLAFALAVLVILAIEGFAAGVFTSYTGIVRNTQADFWIRAKGYGFLPASLAGEVAAAPGVQSVTRLWAVPVMADINGRKLPLTLYGYDTESGLGGPWQLAEGRRPAAANEIVLDRVLAQKHRLEVGAELKLQGREFQIAGLSAETNSFMSFLAFAQLDEVGRLLGAPTQATYLLVNTVPGTAAQAIESRLTGPVLLQTPDEMRAEWENRVDQIMGAPLRLLQVVAALVALAIVALTTYSGVLERRMEYGVLRALGMSGIGVGLVIGTEVAVGALVGVLAGVFVSAGFTKLIGLAMPAYPIIMTGPSVLRTMGLALLMGLVAALIPLRRIAAIDPAEVFRT